MAPWLRGLGVVPESEGHWFDSRSGHMSVLRAGPLPGWGRLRGNRSVFLLNVSLPLFLPPFALFINK